MRLTRKQKKLASNVLLLLAFTLSFGLTGDFTTRVALWIAIFLVQFGASTTPGDTIWKTGEYFPLVLVLSLVVITSIIPALREDWWSNFLRMHTILIAYFSGLLDRDS